MKKVLLAAAFAVMAMPGSNVRLNRYGRSPSPAPMAYKSGVK